MDGIKDRTSCLRMAVDAARHDGKLKTGSTLLEQVSEEKYRGKAARGIELDIKSPLSRPTYKCINKTCPKYLQLAAQKGCVYALGRDLWFHRALGAWERYT